MAPSVTRLSTTPIRAMSAMRMRPEEKTMALGGVAMGSMKAPLEAKATGAAKNNGWTPIPTARMPATGVRSNVKARLLISSVANNPMPVTSTNMAP